MQCDELLLEITRCPELAKAQVCVSHPCSAIAGCQVGEKYHVPEPWSGHIGAAPILFVSSNPSIDEREHYPTPGWTDARTIEFFQRRFDPDAGYSYSAFRKVHFWASVRRRAGEILNRDAIQGKDFALTELVHCKSRGEHGVEKALATCSGRWLTPVMECASAGIVILLGRHARNTCARLWQLDSRKAVHFSVPVAGRKRAVVILPHPNAFQKKTVASNATSAELDRLRSLLRSSVV